MPLTNASEPKSGNSSPTEYPSDLLAKAASGYPLSKDDLQRAERALAAKGWLCVNWPVEHGGPGWTTNQKYIFDQETRARRRHQPGANGRDLRRTGDLRLRHR